MIVLIVIGIIMTYCMIGGASAARHHAIASKKCGYDSCFGNSWCGHCMVSVWGLGVFWPLALPALIGTKAGLSTKSERVEKRRSYELAEAGHKKELARINAETIALQEKEAGIV